MDPNTQNILKIHLSFHDQIQYFKLEVEFIKCTTNLT